MEIAAQVTKANAFRALHHGSRILLLANAWDVASARTLEEAGVSAIATTSAGIAFTLGYPDGQKISRHEMLAVVARIAAKVNVPVTADVEAGYGDRPEDAALTSEGVIKAGAVGLNLEDGAAGVPRRVADLSLQLEKILAIREMAQRMGVPLVVNARTDVYLAQVGAPETRYGETVRRLAAYRDAGADCLFAPGVRDVQVIEQLVRELKHPINVLAGPGSPSVPELQKLGVARVSLGSSVMRATLGVVGRIAQELREAGTYRTLQDAPSHTELNRLMARED